MFILFIDVCCFLFVVFCVGLFLFCFSFLFFVLSFKEMLFILRILGVRFWVKLDEIFVSCGVFLLEGGPQGEGDTLTEGRVGEGEPKGLVPIGPGPTGPRLACAWGPGLRGHIVLAGPGPKATGPGPQALGPWGPPALAEMS